MALLLTAETRSSCVSSKPAEIPVSKTVCSDASSRTVLAADDRLTSPTAPALIVLTVMSPDVVVSEMSFASASVDETTLVAMIAPPACTVTEPSAAVMFVSVTASVSSTSISPAADVVRSMVRSG